MTKTNKYNPDVLSCISNLSNDEVFTPPEVVNNMLDMLPNELWSNKEAKFLDPCCKTGVFLREIAKRLLKGLELEIPNLQERIDHIFHNQLYGIAVTELTSLLSRRSVYCSKYPNCRYSISLFDNIEGNIRYKRVEHTWYDGRCVYCGATKKDYDRDKSLENYAYEFIHNIKIERIFDMKFDVIIGNPPYQLSDGGSGPSASPLYDKFVLAAKKLNPKYISMIIPSRWFAGGKGLDDFRDNMLNDSHLKEMVDYVNSAECFAGVDIAGGVNYFLWDRSYVGDCKVTTVRGDKRNTSMRKMNQFDIFVRSQESLSIIDKVRLNSKVLMDTIVQSRNPFGFDSKSRGETTESSKNNIKLVNSTGIGYVSIDDVQKNIENVDKWKISIGKLVPSNGEVGIDPSKGYMAMTQPRLLPPNYVITDSYLVLAFFDTELEAVNFQKYMTTKFTRFLMHETYSSMNISKSNFRFVPFLDFKEEWSDEKLYKYFNLSKDEIDFIESMIRPMTLDGEKYE